MIFKKRYIRVIRDFPEGCGVPSQHKSNFDESLMQSKCKIIVRTKRDFPDFSKKIKESSDQSETRTSGFDNTSKEEKIMRTKRDFPDFSKKIKESSDQSETGTSGFEGFDKTSNGGGVKEHKKKEVKGPLECSTKVRKISSETKRNLSFDSSTMAVQKDGVDSSKRDIVSGLAARSKCPWSQPKNRGSRQEKRKSETKTSFLFH